MCRIGQSEARQGNRKAIGIQTLLEAYTEKTLFPIPFTLNGI